MVSEKTFNRHPMQTPEKEMKRRWAALGQKMQEKELDCLIFYGASSANCGQVRYITDIHLDRTPAVVVLYPDGIMNVVAGGSIYPKQETQLQNIEKTFVVPNIEAVQETAFHIGKKVCCVLESAHCNRVGIVSPDKYPVSIYSCLREQFQGELLDGTDIFDSVVSIKSEYEIEAILESARQHDRIAEMVPSLIRRGAKEYEIREEMNHIAHNLGFTDTNMNITVSKSHAGFVPVFFQTKEISDGDYATYLVQGNGPGGMAIEVGRIVSMGKVSSAMRQAYLDAIEVQEFIAESLVPGAIPWDIFTKANQLLVRMGYGEEWRLFGHGQGQSLIERPVIMPGDRMPLQENMVLALHPTAGNREVAAFSCDSYIIKKDGACRINAIPQEIIEL